MKSYKDLNVYKESIVFVSKIYLITQSFPKNETFGLVSQLRRASISIPSNIAEGAFRRSSKEFIQFLYIAYGSCAEIETQLVISESLGFISKEALLKALEDLQSISKMLNGLIQSIQRKSLNTNHQPPTTTQLHAHSDSY